MKFVSGPTGGKEEGAGAMSSESEKHCCNKNKDKDI